MWSDDEINGGISESYVLANPLIFIFEIRLPKFPGKYLATELVAEVTKKVVKFDINVGNSIEQYMGLSYIVVRRIL